jgi:NADP-dependent 3-hydroxy acid dehydrogenase YdfG
VSIRNAAARSSPCGWNWFSQRLRDGFEQKENPTKLRAEDIAHSVKAILEMDDHVFTSELSIFATNPKNRPC